MTARPMARAARLVAVVTAAVVTACAGPGPSPTPVPTTAPTPSPADATGVAARYLAAWNGADYAAMYALLAPSVQERYTLEAFTALHVQLAELPRIEAMEGDLGEPSLIGLPPEPRHPELPAPTPVPTPAPTAGAGGSPVASPAVTPVASPAPAGPPPPLEGPVLATEIGLDLRLVTERFGDLDLERTLVLSQGPDEWEVRWTPATLFPELGDGGELVLERATTPRGRILAADGTVLADNTEEGVRIYPQESLAGQTVGYVSEVTAEDLETLAAEGYQPGDVVGRSGLEAGAEDLLRGTPGYTLYAVPAGGEPVELYSTEPVPGADISTTIVPSIQATAEAAIAGYAGAGTAAIDPATGDVWALASAPAFNPNSVTLGTTLGGIPLAPPDFAQILNKATSAAYPAGSTFKPFTLAAALHTGVATPQTLVTCPPTWDYSGFRFQNYEEHQLPGLVSLAEAMAFSCNTTYMPLSLQVYDVDPTAFPALVGEFGFGQPTGIRHLPEEAGILPDAEYFATTEGRDYGPFDQIQLSIGQGSFLGTPLQLTMAFAAIGNAGTLWTPRLVTQATLPDGEVVVSYEPEVRRQVSVSPANLAYVIDTMEAVVTLPYGTGTAAFAGFGLPVAGKSGTAETSTPNPDSWFAAVAPADAPTVAVVTVLVEEPLSTGGADAAPLVRAVMGAHFAR